MERRLTRFSGWGYAALALLLAALSLVMFPAPAEPAALTATTTPTVAASGTPTATPTRGTAQPASGGVKRVTDDFEDPSSGWPRLEFDNYFVGYHEPTYYHVQVSAPGDNVVAPYPKLKFADLWIEATAFADAANTAPQGDFRYGIALRRTGKQFYAFAISPRSQSWYVLKSSATRLDVLAQGKTGPVPGAGGENKLRAEARGPALTFLLDGKVVSQLQDAAYASGEAGFYVETLDAPRVHVHFDTITIEGSDTPWAAMTDDFEDPSSGWPQLEFGNYFVGYHEPTYYHVQVSAPGDNVVAPYPKRTFGNLAIEATAFADAANTAPQGDFRYGIALRRTGKQFYAFAISPRSQNWYVLKSSATRLEVLAQGKTGPVPGAGGENKLRAEARGPALTFLLDGKVVSQLQDAAYASGEAGFYVETLDAPRVHVHFDTIRIEPVQAVAPSATATPPAAAAAGSCRVLSWALNIRRGPGTQFVPDTALVRGAVLEPLERTADGQWVRVRIPETGQVGWVSRGFIACTVDPGKLPVYVF